MGALIGQNVPKDRPGFLSHRTAGTRSKAVIGLVAIYGRRSSAWPS
jgi:hypothetical protein